MFSLLAAIDPTTAAAFVGGCLAIASIGLQLRSGDQRKFYGDVIVERDKLLNRVATLELAHEALVVRVEKAEGDAYTAGERAKRAERHAEDCAVRERALIRRVRDLEQSS